MKLNFRNLSLLGVVMTLCVAGLGIGYGHWTQTINISGTAIVENMAVEWVGQRTNDPQLLHGHIDQTILDGFIGAPFNVNPPKDVGWTDCNLILDTGDSLYYTIEFNVYNAYPGYLGIVTGDIMNEGDLAVQIDTVDVDYLGYQPEGGTYVDYGGAYDYTSPPNPYTSLPEPPGVYEGWIHHPPEFEVKWTNGTTKLPIVINGQETIDVSCYVHVLDGAQQNTVYTFRATFHVIGPVPAHP